MEDQVPSSNIPQSQPMMDQGTPFVPGISSEQLAEMKRIALERAIQQHQQIQQVVAKQAETVYVRRNLTVAELLLVFLLSCGIVTGAQFAWNFATDILPRIEIRSK